MLCQLVCVDRRYQRMNCFNIRELQSMLKKRFFDDLILSHDYHNLLNNSMVNLRFKLNNTSAITSDILQFHQFGITNTLKQKTLTFNSLTSPVDVVNYGVLGGYSYITNLVQNVHFSDLVQLMNV